MIFKMDESKAVVHRLEKYEWKGEGYQPMVECRDWLVALMNWENRFDPGGAGEIERHNDTDEVFALTHGHSIIFIVGDAGLEVADMQPGVLYNVPRGTWHNVIGSHDASWLIVEANDTREDNSNYRQLTGDEWQALRDQFPAWLK
jgi:mannose-6-phosphate isomerase-like protein (cupin superfamily)